MSIDPLQYRAVLGHFPTGVTVVTGIIDDEPVGFTVGSFTSVSIDPPLVGFLAMVDSDRWKLLRTARSFCVNILADDQDDLCWTFAKSSIEHPFEGIDWTPAPVTGAPLIAGVAAWIDCSHGQIVDAGDHHFVMGQVEALGHAEGEPGSLVFFKGKLGGFSLH